MQFRFYIVDADSCVTGTDDEQVVAMALKDTDNLAIIDSELGKDISCAEDLQDIDEQDTYVVE